MFTADEFHLRHFFPLCCLFAQRLLIPLTAGGLIIGRKGANIAALLEASGARVTLGQKAEIKANERLVTVQGRLPAATKVCSAEKVHVGAKYRER